MNETELPEKAKHRCSKCQLPCEVYMSRSRIFGTQSISLCCKAPAKILEP